MFAGAALFLEPNDTSKPAIYVSSLPWLNLPGTTIILIPRKGVRRRSVHLSRLLTNHSCHPFDQLPSFPKHYGGTEITFSFLIVRDLIPRLDLSCKCLSIIFSDVIVFMMSFQTLRDVPSCEDMISSRLISVVRPALLKVHRSASYNQI